MPRRFRLRGMAQRRVIICRISAGSPELAARLDQAAAVCGEFEHVQLATAARSLVSTPRFAAVGREEQSRGHPFFDAPQAREFAPPSRQYLAAWTICRTGQRRANIRKRGETTEYRRNCLTCKNSGLTVILRTVMCFQAALVCDSRVGQRRCMGRPYSASEYEEYTCGATARGA